MKRNIRCSIVCFIWILYLSITLPPNSQAFTNFGSTGATVSNLQFFESDENIPPVNERKFTNSFLKSSARYIFYQLSLSHTELSARVDITLKARYYKADGSFFGEFDHNIYMLPEWKTSWHANAWGWKNPGNWQLGNYTLKLFYGTEEIASGNFSIVNEINEPDETSIEGLDIPNGVSVTDMTSNPSSARVYMGNIAGSSGNMGTLSGKMELSVDFPAYSKPVDIWILVGLPDGRFYLADEAGRFLNLDDSGFLTIASGVAGTKTTKTILTTFETPSDNLSAVVTPFDPFPTNGEWTVYWLIAPASNGDIIKALENGNYELGFYIFGVTDSNNGNDEDSITVNSEKGGVITLADGAVAEFPAKCSDSDISAFFTKSSEAVDIPNDENAKAISGVYKLKVLSSAPVTNDISISLPVDTDTLPALPEGFSESDRRFFMNLEFYNEYTEEWQRYGSLLFYDVVADIVTVPIALSDFKDSQISKSKNRSAGDFSEPESQVSRQNQRAISMSDGVKYRITHLTDYGMKIVQQEGSPFEFVYYTCVAQLQDSVSCFSEPVPGASSDPDVDDYIELLDKVLQQAYTKLTTEAVDKNGNKVFTTLSTPQRVIVKDLGADAEGATIIGGPMVIDNNRQTSTLGSLATHELIHVLQGQHYRGISTLNTAAISRWFVEGTADHYSEFVFPAPNDSPDKNFLSVPIDVSDQLSYYSVKFFLRWLAETYGDKIVGDTLRWRSSPNGSVYDTINLSNAIGENGSFMNDSLETAFEKYCIYVMQNPDISPNSSIKSYMEMFLTHDENGSKISTYLTNPEITFTTQKTYFMFNKNIQRLSASYMAILSQHTDNVKLVIAPVSKQSEANSIVKSMTYIGKGTTQSDYESKKTVESQNSIDPAYLSYKTISANDIKQGTIIEHMLYNPTQDKSLSVNLQYYILAPPKISQVGSGTNGGIIVWSTQGIGSKDAIPADLIKGFDVYDKNGIKLNSTMIALPSTVGSDQSFENSSITAGDNISNYTVVIEDVYGNRCPEVKIVDTANCGEVIDYSKLTKVEDATNLCYLNKDNLRHGLVQSWYDSSRSQLSGQVSYCNGKQEGVGTFWYKNGNKQQEATYSNDVLNGLWTSWYENGNKYAEGNYVNDQIDGTWKQWYSDGSIYIENNYKNGQLDGLWISWHKNGNVESEGYYTNGKKAGVWREWDGDGKCELISNYDSGDLYIPCPE